MTTTLPTTTPTPANCYLIEAYLLDDPIESFDRYQPGDYTGMSVRVALTLTWLADSTRQSIENYLDYKKPLNTALSIPDGYGGYIYQHKSGTQSEDFLNSMLGTAARKLAYEAPRTKENFLDNLYVLVDAKIHFIIYTRTRSIHCLNERIHQQGLYANEATILDIEKYWSHPNALACAVAHAHNRANTVYEEEKEKKAVFGVLFEVNADADDDATTIAVDSTSTAPLSAKRELARLEADFNFISEQLQLVGNNQLFQTWKCLRHQLDGYNTSRYFVGTKTKSVKLLRKQMGITEVVAEALFEELRDRVPKLLGGKSQ